MCVSAIAHHYPQENATKNSITHTQCLCLKENFTALKANKKEQISETGGATPIKIDLHAFQVNLYFHEFFEPILFFDPHGL